MVKAALYARVSSDKQKQEGTIESQVAELRRQIAAAGCILAKEYVDDGYSGAQMARPALQELRSDLGKNLFDVIYFLAADRIARQVIYQTIIISEMVLAKKRIVINGQEYEDKSENRFSLTVLGAVAELERAKITERMARGKLHRLRQGIMASGGGVCCYGYQYVQRSPAAPAQLLVRESEAEIVRYMFEACAGGMSINEIARSLEARGVPTRTGKRLWDRGHLKTMLQHTAYAGTKYFNRMTFEKDPDGKKRGKVVPRDRSEWIGIAVPAIVSAALFERVQERLADNARRYCQPATHYTLSGMVECGLCGSTFSSYRRYLKSDLVTGVRRVSHKSAYKCLWRTRAHQHAPSAVERCTNPEIATHLLEGKVFDMIQDTLLDPDKLRRCLAVPAKRSARGLPQLLAGIAKHAMAIDEERKRLIELYATERMESREYVEANKLLDEKLARLKRKKAELAEGVRPRGHDATLDAAIRRYCDEAQAQLAAATDFDGRRAFLTQRVERVIVARYKVTLLGSLSVAAPDDAEPHTVPFQVEGVVDLAAQRRKPRAPQPGDGRFKKWNPNLLADRAAIAQRRLDTAKDQLQCNTAQREASA